MNDNIDNTHFLCGVYVDYIIAGQGISGTFLSYYLIRAGKRVLVIDDYNPMSASRVASGVINPVTGRRVVTTWMIDELLPFAANAYHEIGADLGLQLMTETHMVNFHTTQQMQASWYSRVAEGSEYIRNVSNVDSYDKYFTIPHGIGLTQPCLLINLDLLLSAWRQKLISDGLLLEGKLNVNDISFGDGGVYLDNIQAQKLILCNGVQGFENKYFSKLPYTFNKGEALIVHIPGLPSTAIYKYGVSLVPLGNELFWVGSSFEWEFEREGPTDQFLQATESTLNKWLKIPYKVIEHKASVRPASIERRPFVGMHPEFHSIGIFNGMGTKGCSLAPYFAAQFVDSLINYGQINMEADINRFKKILCS